jgi:hypothetical protein
VIADVYRVALNWTNTVNTWKATNVMHFHKTSSSPSSVWTIIDTNVTAAMWGFQVNNCSVHDAVVTPLDGSSVSYPIVTGSPAKWTGLQVSGDIIPQGSNVIKMLTAKRGRSYRGRVFVPWLSEGQQNFGTLTGATVTSVTTAWVAFHTALTAAGLDMVIASYKLGTADNVAALVCEPAAATQRRRLVR